MNARRTSLVIGTIAAMVGAATAASEQLGLTTQHVAILGVLSAGFAFVQMQLPSAGINSRRKSRAPAVVP